MQNDLKSGVMIVRHPINNDFYWTNQSSLNTDPCFGIGIMKHSMIAHWKVAYIFNDGRQEQASFHKPGCRKTDFDSFRRSQTSILQAVLLVTGRLSAL